jgi:hypothetical protein
MLLELCLGDQSEVQPVIATMFRFTIENLLRPSRPPEGSKYEKKMKPHIETKLCDSDGINCVGGQK